MRHLINMMMRGSGQFLEFMNRLPLQIVIAAPPDKIQYIGPKMQETLLVLTDDKVSFVEEYRYASGRNKILNDLLDKYENSKLSRGENQRAIHIAFPFNKKTMPKYFDESSLR